MCCPLMCCPLPYACPQLLYDRALEARILLQKVVTGANRLPLPGAVQHLQQEPAEVGRAPVSHAIPEGCKFVAVRIVWLHRLACNSLLCLETVQHRMGFNDSPARPLIKKSFSYMKGERCWSAVQQRAGQCIFYALPSEVAQTI